METRTAVKFAFPKQVKKNDGYQMPFGLYKIIHILQQMNISTSDQELIMAQLADSWAGQDQVTTAEIRHTLLAVLREQGLNDAADQYLTVRHQQLADWEVQTNPEKRLARLQSKDPTLVHENANKDSNVFNTQRDLTAGTVGKTLGLKMMPEHVAKAHLRGDIHWHDLDYTPWSPMTNCCLIDFKEMLTNGFKIGNAEVESPKSIQTATAQMAQIIANVASSQYGGCSADRIDEVLEPFALRNYEKHLRESAEFIDDPDKQ